MRIGLAADFYYPWIGGPAVAIHNLALGLAARGHKVHLLVPSTDGAAGVEHNGALEITRVRTVPVPFGYKLRAALPPRGVAAWLDRNALDVVHIHHPFPLSTAAALGARRRRIPLVATNHTIPSCSLWGIRELGPVYTVAHEAMRRWIVWLLRQCDAIATPTETAARLLRELGLGAEIRVISNGIDVDRFSPGARDPDLADRLDLDAREVVLYTGRLDAEKQMDVWLHAAAYISRALDVQFVVGGEGADRPRLEKLARDLGIGESTRFIGYVSEGELPALYRLADVYLTTSPVELQSISTLEAIATGLPVVAVDAAALPELVQDATNGYLVVHGDWERAGKAVMRILQDGEQRRAMAESSREIALGHAIARSVDAYERLFLEAMTRAQGDRRVEQLSAPGW